MLKRTEIRLAVLAFALLGTAAAWYLISPLFITAMYHAGFPTLGFLPTRTPRPATATPLPSQTPTADLGQNLLVDMASAQLVVQGEFYAVDHAGQGAAVIYLLTDGSLVLHLENFQVDGGAELHIVLSSQEAIENSSQADLTAMVDVDPLKATAGNQNYLLPAGLNIDEIHSVLIWSSTGEVFIAASLQTP